MSDIKETVDLSSVIQTFENDIKYDAHRSRTKAMRSDAGKKLIKAGRSALADIALHLEETRPPAKGIYDDLPLAWCWLLNQIRVELQISIKEAPTTLGEFDAWIAWAKRESANKSN